MKPVFAKPKAINDEIMHYCPGCSHGIAHRLVAEALDHFEITERTVGVAPVGCSVLMYDYFNCDVIEAPHGRAPAVATGMKRSRSDLIVFAYQGDGDLAAIGLSEIVHAANRGYPIRMAEMLATLEGTTYVARMALDKPANILRARKSVFKAFEMQIKNIGFSFVELLATCSTNWGMDSRESIKRLQDELIPYFPLTFDQLKGKRLKGKEILVFDLF
jgi:2-oxoglutarate ferredoxin oxidoreductase subunit beta